MNICAKEDNEISYNFPEKEFKFNYKHYNSLLNHIKFLESKVIELINLTSIDKGDVVILKEQQEIMHNFLVEINKYLANKK